MKTLPAILLILGIGGLVALLIFQKDELKIFYGKVNTVDETESVQVSPVAPTAEEIQDQEYKIAIATSYCNILRKQEKVRIENFNDCITTMAAKPLDIYKSMTGEQLTKNWEVLALNEKQLVLQEVKLAEVKIYVDMEEKTTYDYLNCESNRNKEENKWLEEKCPPNSPPGMNLHFQDFACQQKIKATAEYTVFIEQFDCKEPW